MALAPYSPEIFSEVFNLVSAKIDKPYMVQKFWKLLPHIPENLLTKAFEVACNISYQRDRATTLKYLAPYLPENLFVQALETVCILEEQDYTIGDRSDVLKAFMTRMSSCTVDFAVWKAILHSLATVNRNDFYAQFSHLVTIIEKFGESQAFKNIGESIKQVDRWFK